MLDMENLIHVCSKVLISHVIVFCVEIDCEEQSVSHFIWNKGHTPCKNKTLLNY